MSVNARNPPQINGIHPKAGERFFAFSYENLNLKTNFTGVLLALIDRSQRQQPPRKPALLEFRVIKGDIIAANIPRTIRRPQQITKEDILSWIKQKFALKRHAGLQLIITRRTGAKFAERESRRTVPILWRNNIASSTVPDNQQGTKILSLLWKSNFVGAETGRMQD